MRRKCDCFKLFVLLGILLSSIPVDAKAQLMLNALNDTVKITFSGFKGKGLTPTAGFYDTVLNSNMWAIYGESANSYFGNTSVSGIFAMGITQLPVTNGGIFAFADTVRSDTMMMIQPVAASFTPGHLVLRIQNNTTDTLTGLFVAYHLFVRNDQARANSFNFSHTADTNNYTPVPALDYTSPGAASGTALIDEGIKSVTLSGIEILPGQYYYLRWSTNDVSGSGSRDEFFIDNIQIAGLQVSGDLLPPSVTGMSIITNTEIKIFFNEPVDTTAENPSNYAGLPAIASIVRNTGLDTVTLYLASPILNGKSYTLIVSGVKDLAGNTMSPVYTKQFVYNNLSAGLVINEIYYNSPGSGTDSLEFIELFNNTGVPINIGGIYFTHGVFDTLPDSILAPGAYFVTAYFPNVFQRYFGFTPKKWSGNNLSNAGERVAIVNTIGDTIDALFYQPSAPWPVTSDDNARSIGLIHPDLDNSQPSNWRASAVRFGLFNNLPGWATPGQTNFVTTPEPIEPADGTYIPVSSTSPDNVTFRWSESLVPVGGSVLYILELVDTVNTAFNKIYEGTDTTFDYSLANFDDWLAMNNWPAGDTAFGIFWRVTAFDSLNNFVSVHYALHPIREGNQPPMAFNLIEPVNEFRWEIQRFSTNEFYWRWQKAIDPEGDEVFYSIERDTTILMNSPLHGIEFIGEDTFAVDIEGEVWEELQSLGLDSMDIYWRVVAEDAQTNYTLSNQIWKVRVVLLPSETTVFRADLSGYQEVPPTPSTATGNGYFELNNDSTQLFYRIYVSGLTGITAAHIHNAPSGANGGAVYMLTFTGDSAVGTWNIPANMVTELFNGNLYINVHTNSYPAGEIRGQIYVGIAAANLEPAEDLNAIAFDNFIELNWEEPWLLKKDKTNRFADAPLFRKGHQKHMPQSNPNGTEALLTGYNIYRSDNGSPYQLIGTTDLLYYRDSSVIFGTNYSYFVSALYVEGQAPPTDTVISTLIEPFTFTEGFNDTSMYSTGALPAGWTKVDADGSDEDPFWGEWRIVPDLNDQYTTFEGNGMIFNTYMAANSNGLIDEWLITPRLIPSRDSVVRLSFAIRSAGGFWPDSIQILVSKTTPQLNQFQLIDYFLVPDEWEIYNYNLNNHGVTSGDSFYVAFRYLIYDGGSFGSNSNLVTVDLVRIDAHPVTIGIRHASSLPKKFELYPNYPNPFNPTTSIQYDLKERSKVTLKIYNTLGQEIRTLVNAEQPAGQYTIQWDGKNSSGQFVASGVYIYRIQAGSFVKSRKMMLIK